MSGAAEVLAGLALSAIGVASLFTTCIECFDIVIAGKNFSEDFEQLCTLLCLALFSLERARFGLWGESVGLIPEPNNGSRLKYNKNIDRPDIRPGVERILNNIRLLLEDGARINKKYGETLTTQHSTSQGMQVFKTSFDRFKFRIRKHQRDTSAWKVTSWAVHDAKAFEISMERLRRYVDGLESITKSLGLLEHQHSRLIEEIDSISDVESLRLLRNASSNHANPAAQDISDTASNRMLTIVQGECSSRNTTTSSSDYDSDLSFKTARTRKSTEIRNINCPTPKLPGACLHSFQSSAILADLETHCKSGNLCQEYLDLDGTYSCESRSCFRCLKSGISKRLAKDLNTKCAPVFHMAPARIDTSTEAFSTPQLSQNPRLRRFLNDMNGPCGPYGPYVPLSIQW